MLYTLEAGDCLFCVQFIEVPEIYGNVCGDKNCFSLNVIKFPMRAEKARKFLKDRAFYQSKCDKNSDKGRENMRILEKTVLFLSLKVTKILGKAEKARKFLKDRAFYQSKCDKNYYKGRENMRILEKTVLFLSLKVTKILGKAEKARKFLKDRAFYQSKCDKNSYKGRENMKEGKEHGIDIYS